MKGKERDSFRILYMGYPLSIIKIKREIERERERKREKEIKERERERKGSHGIEPKQD